ncbi:MAG: Tetratricopeptide 2 repeat protein [Bryobacterales bacterium]|nr:Tetratricopeptide 2 repeat protein [Bryobacterales bacterium]
MSCSRCLSPVLLALLFIGCSRMGPVGSTQGPPPGFAFVRFENLSGDASLEWVALAASEVLSSSLAGVLDGPVIAGSSITRLDAFRGGRPGGTPGISGQRSSVVLAGAKRMISGYFERTPTGIRLQATDEDLTSGKTVRILSAAGPATIETLLRLARQFAPAAHPYLTGNTEALRLYASSLEAPPLLAEESLRKTVVADPSFGPPWILAVRLAMLQNKRDEALRLISEAQANKLDRLSLASLKMEQAALRGDQNGQLAALNEVIELSPGDTSLLRQLAETRTKTGDFAGAAAAWQRLSLILRDDADVWNQMGYTRAWAGDYRGALTAMAEYARVRPNDANPLDSTGDVHFLFRKYSEAAASYGASVNKDPALQLGASLYKQAWAKFYAGDRAGGDKLIDQLRTQREKANVTNFHLFQADWLYRTGREKEAVALLRKESQSQTSPEARVSCVEQLVVWDLLGGDRAAAAKDAEAVGQPKNPLSALARFVAMPSATPEEWQKRAETMLPGPQLAPIRRLALGYGLLLDGKKQAAIPIWEQINASTQPADFGLREVLPRLQGKKPALATLPNPNGVNQFAAVIDRL